MTEHTASQEPSQANEPETDSEHPLGTLFVLMVFLIALAGMWGAVYLIYLGR